MRAAVPFLDPSDPRAPKYWQHETTGVLRPVIEAYLYGRQLGPNSMAVMRAYLRQWIMSPVWDASPHADDEELRGLRDLIDSLTTRAQIDTWLERALEIGIDPL